MVAVILGILLFTLSPVSCSILVPTRSGPNLPAARSLSFEQLESGEGNAADRTAHSDQTVLEPTRRLSQRGLDLLQSPPNHGKDAHSQNSPSGERKPQHSLWKSVFSDLACGIGRGSPRQRHGRSPDSSSTLGAGELDQCPRRLSQTSPSNPQLLVVPERQLSEPGFQRSFVMAPGRPPRPLSRQDLSRKETGRDVGRKKEDLTAE